MVLKGTIVSFVIFTCISSGLFLRFLLLFVLSASEPLIALLNKGLLESKTFGESDDGVLGLTDDKDVFFTGSEGSSQRVLDVSDIVGTGVALNVLEDTDTTNIVSTLNEDGGTIVEFNDTIDFISLEVQL